MTAIKKQYNTCLTALLAQCDNINHSTLLLVINSAATKVLTDSTDWFQLSKEALIKVICLCDIAMKEFNCSRLASTRSTALECLCWAQKQVKLTVTKAKELWLKTMCSKVERGSAFNSWAAVNDIKGGLTGHYSAPKQSKLMKGDGAFAKSDTGAGEIFCKHFQKVYNNVRPIDKSVLDGVEQRETMDELGVAPHPIEVREAMKRIAKLQDNRRE